MDFVVKRIAEIHCYKYLQKSHFSWVCQYCMGITKYKEEVFSSIQITNRGPPLAKIGKLLSSTIIIEESIIKILG